MRWLTLFTTGITALAAAPASQATLPEQERPRLAFGGGLRLGPPLVLLVAGHVTEATAGHCTHRRIPPVTTDQPSRDGTDACAPQGFALCFRGLRIHRPGTHHCSQCNTKN